MENLDVQGQGAARLHLAVSPALMSWKFLLLIGTETGLASATVDCRVGHSGRLTGPQPVTPFFLLQIL
jgi:hypothetical protein